MNSRNRRQSSTFALAAFLVSGLAVLVGLGGWSTPQIPPAGVLGCGPAALLRAASVLSPHAADRLSRTLLRDPQATQPACDMADLAQWAQSAGFVSIGIRMPAEELGRVPLPIIAHLTGDHFVAVLAADEGRLRVADGPYLTKWMSRQDFGRCFSGYALCLGRK